MRRESPEVAEAYERALVNNTIFAYLDAIHRYELHEVPKFLERMEENEPLFPDLPVRLV